MSVPELLLPAGGFDQAIAAIEGGADALYLGFSDFSARKQARNFDRTAYRRLLRFARERGVRLYAALNTVIVQRELEAAADLLAFLGRFPPDAVIVQDWGLARLIRERHPSLPIHASTQAACQGAEGARMAIELGAARVVLPRETSLSDMAALHRELPGLELEAFVHGALCYSFSGLCLASGLVLGRSGNRGECAQLCRSSYAFEGPAAPPSLVRREGCWFSCKDLDLGDRVDDLIAAGISSLKIEGRMKSPEYCFALASLYRGILDRLAGASSAPGEAEIEARREAAALAFSRSPTQAWIEERGGAFLLDPEYPGHRGLPAGRIARNDGGRLSVDLERPLGLRDGLLGFEDGDSARPVRFPVLELRDPRSGRGLVRARAGSKVELLAQSEGIGLSGLRVGDEFFRISAREQDRKAVSLEEFEAAREELQIRLSFGRSGLDAVLSLPTFEAEEPAHAARAEACIEAGENLVLDRARSPGGLARALAVFAEAGEADFRLEPRAEGTVELDSGEVCAAADLFVPPSILKREKNRLYSKAAGLVSAASASYARESVESCRSRARAAMGEPRPNPAPPRAALVFPRQGLPAGLPFATRGVLASGTALPEWGGRSWLPLAPLVADREGYGRLVHERVASSLGEGRSIVLGLGALHHIALARSLSESFPEAGSRLGFFLDINLYLANELAFASLASLAGGVEFGYGYLEIEDQDGCEALAPVGPGFEPPLFQSLGCFYKHHIVSSRCPDSCSRAWQGILSDRERRYLVIVEDCVTTLFRLPSPRR
jgi:putative protease